MTEAKAGRNGRAGGSMRNDKMGTALGVLVLLLFESHWLLGQGPSPLADYAGPSLLTRPGVAAGRAGEAPSAYRVFVSAFGTYSTDLTAFTADALGRFPDVDSLGGMLTVGGYAYRSTERSVLGLDYRGSYRAYSRAKSYNGTDHFLTLSYSRRLSFQTAVDFQQGLATYARAFRGYITPLIADPLADVVDPSEEAVDARTYASITSAGLSHMFTERWSAELHAAGFVVRRHARGLLGSQGATAGAGLYRALGPHTSLGAFYRFAAYLYQHDVGRTDVHSAGLAFWHQLTPIWTFSLAGGAFRAENERLVQVSLDPLIALLLGQPRALEVFHQIYYGRFTEATLAGHFERSTLSFYYHRGIRPGTAFFATSSSETGGAAYSYTATERLNLGLNAFAGRHKGLLQWGTQWRNYGATLGTNYRLSRVLYFTAHAGLHRYQLPQRGFDRNRLYVGVGLTLSPGERPLSLW